MEPPDLKTPILDDLNNLLAPLGFRKAGTLFSADRGEVVHLIQLQSSQKSTAQQILVTVNVGVFVPRLGPATPGIPQSHWRQRIGSLMPERQDKWWSINNVGDSKTVAAEIARCVEHFGLTALRTIPNIAALKALWEGGISPGLTSGERTRFLAQVAAWN